MLIQLQKTNYFKVSVLKRIQGTPTSVQ